jgi:hypothetical protein
MNRYSLIIPLIVISGLYLLTDNAQASTICHSSSPINWCQGYAWVGTQTGGTSAERCFALRTTNTAPTCTTTGLTPVNESTWEMDAGQCITLYYFDTSVGVVPPAAPNKVTISVKFDSASTTIKTFQSLAAEPANGSSYSFCATSTGDAGATNRAGTYRLYLNLVKDNGNGLPGNTNYNIDTDGVASVGTIPSAHFDKGVLRGLQVITAISRNTYPADATYAFGTSTDELITITGVFTQPNGDNNVECMNTAVYDDATRTVGATGSVVDIDSTTSLIQSFVADSTFPSVNSPYRMMLETGKCNAAVTGMPWTKFTLTGHGTNIVRDGDFLAHLSPTFNVNPNIIFDSDGSGTFASADDMWLNKLTNSGGTVVTKYNRGETAYTEGYLFNSRGEQLTRAMTFTIEDAATTTCTSLGSLTPSLGKYSTTYTIPTAGSCTVANTDPGSPRYIRTTNTDQNHLSILDHYVSSLYYIDSHLELDSALTKDDYPTEDSTEDLTYRISNDITDTSHGWCHVKSVRKDVDVDTSGSVITWSYIDPDSTTRFTGTTDTASDGWTSTHLDLLASTPLGTWIFRCTIGSFNGNSATGNQLFVVEVPESEGTGFPGDPLRILCAPIIANPGETITCVAAESNNDGSARTGNSLGTLHDIWNPSNTQIVTGGATTEIGTTGNYRFTYALGSSPAAGSYIVVVRTTDASPVSSSTVFFVETDGVATAINNLAIHDTAQTTQHDIIDAHINDVETDLTIHNDNNTDYHGHINYHLHNLTEALYNVSVHFDERIDDIIVGNVTVYDAFGQIIYNQTVAINTTLNEHRERSFEFNMNEFLLLAAIAFFVIMAESRKDALYWFTATILSIYLLINRSSDSIIPLPIYVGWIFVTLYQAVALVMTKRAQNLSSTEE